MKDIVNTIFTLYLKKLEKKPISINHFKTSARLDGGYLYFDFEPLNGVSYSEYVLVETIQEDLTKFLKILGFGDKFPMCWNRIKIGKFIEEIYLNEDKVNEILNECSRIKNIKLKRGDFKSGVKVIYLGEEINDELITLNFEVKLFKPRLLDSYTIPDEYIKLYRNKDAFFDHLRDFEYQMLNNVLDTIWQEDLPLFDRRYMAVSPSVVWTYNNQHVWRYD